MDRASTAMIPRALIESTTRSVMHTAVGRAGTIGATSATAAKLADGVLRGLVIARWRAGAALLAAILLGTAIGGAVARFLGPEDDPNA